MHAIICVSADCPYDAERLAGIRVEAAPFAVSNSPQFLVIDFHPESRYLLVKTLARKFPGAVIHESEDAEKAIEIVRAIDLIAVITHRTFEVSGVDLVHKLRDADPEVPIVMVSGIDREDAALAAGANAFLNYDAWLRIGAVVEAVLERKPRPPTEGSDVA